MTKRELINDLEAMVDVPDDATVVLLDFRKSLKGGDESVDGQYTHIFVEAGNVNMDADAIEAHTEITRFAPEPIVIINFDNPDEMDLEDYKHG